MLADLEATLAQLCLETNFQQSYPQVLPLENFALNLTTTCLFFRCCLVPSLRARQGYFLVWLGGVEESR